MFADQRYKSDATFARLVDMLRSSLRTYAYTPSELREAAMLASTMHMNENIRPILYKPFGGQKIDRVYLDELLVPYGGFTEQWSWTYREPTGRFNSSKPNKSNVPQSLNRRSPKAVIDRRKNPADAGSPNTRGVFSRNQGFYADTKRNSQGDRRKEVPNHFHTFNFDGTHKDFKVCSCGVSDVYYFALGMKK